MFQSKSINTWTILVFSFCLSVNSYSDSEKSGSHHQLYIYLILQLRYTCIAVSEVLTCTSARNNFINQSPISHTVYFAFGLTDSTHFQKLQSTFRTPASPPLFKAVVSYSFNTVRLCHCVLPFIPRISQMIFF